MTRTAFLLGILAGLSVAGICKAQDTTWVAPGYVTGQPFLPVAVVRQKPSHKPFWILAGAHAGVTVADVWSSERLFKKYPDTWELNPLLPRHPSTARMSLEFAAFSVAGIAATYYLETHGHPKIARVALIAFTGSESVAVINNLRLGGIYARQAAKH